MRKTCLRCFQCSVLFACVQFLAFPGLAHDEDHGTPTTVTGVLTIIQADDFANKRSRRFYFLDDSASGKSYNVQLDDSTAARLQSGARVIIKGVARGSEIVVPAGGEGSVQTIQSAAAVVTGEQRTVVLAISFIDAALECSASAIRGIMFTNAQSVDGLYRETSYDNVWFSGNVYGPYTINYSSTGPCDYNGWASAAEAAAQAQGVNLSQYTRRIYVFPRRNPCGWAGLGTLGGNPSRSWVATCDLADVYAHELGHNLTMHHASTDTNNDGYSDCEYCDTSSFMGYGGIGFRQISAPHKDQMGWLPADKVVNVVASDIYYVAPLEYFPETTSYPQVLKIPKATANTFYYFSYRRRIGYDGTMPLQYADRANVHHYRGYGAVPTYFITALSDGGQFTDAANGVTVTQLAHNNEYVTLQVSFGCSAAAPTVSLSPSNQDGLAGASFTYTLSVTNRDTAHCTPTTFFATPSVPSGWTGSVSPSFLTVGPGQTGTATFTVTSPGETPTGGYAVSVSVSDNFDPVHNASANASCFVDSSPPTAPSNLKGSAKRGKVNLSWAASTDDVSVARYKIWREGVYLGQTTSTRYTDITVNKGNVYSYYVTAHDAANNQSPPSNTALVTVGKLRAARSN